MRKKYTYSNSLFKLSLLFLFLNSYYITFAKSIPVTPPSYWDEVKPQIIINSSADHIILYPNPVKDILNINTGSSDSNMVKVDVHALDGRLMYTSSKRPEYGKVSVNLSKLNKGLHVLILTIGNSKTVHKIIKD